MKRYAWPVLLAPLFACGSSAPREPIECSEPGITVAVGTPGVLRAISGTEIPIDASSTSPVTLTAGPTENELTVLCFAPGTGTITYKGPAPCDTVAVPVTCEGTPTCSLRPDPGELTIEGFGGTSSFVVVGLGDGGDAPAEIVATSTADLRTLVTPLGSASSWRVDVTCVATDVDGAVAVTEENGRCGVTVPVRCADLPTTTECVPEGLYEADFAWGGGGCAHPFTQEIVLVHAGSYEGVEIGGFDSELAYDESTCTFSGEVGGDTLEMTCHGTSCTAHLRNGADGCTYEATATLANHEAIYRHISVPPCGGGTRLGTGAFTEVEPIPGDPTQFALLSGNTIELHAVDAPAPATSTLPIPAGATTPTGLVGHPSASFHLFDAPTRPHSAFIVYEDFGASAFDADASSSLLRVDEPRESEPPHVAEIASDGLHIHEIRETGSTEVLARTSTDWEPGDPNLHVGRVDPDHWWILSDEPTRGWVVSSTGEVTPAVTLPDLGALVDVAGADAHVYALFDDGSASSVLDWAPLTGHVARFTDYSSPGTSIEVVGNTLLVGNGRRVTLDDISSPFRPVPLGQVIGPVNPLDVTRVGNQLFVVDGAQLGGATLGCALPAD